MSGTVQESMPTGGVQPQSGFAFNSAVLSSLSFTNGKQPFSAFLRKYQQFDATRRPVMGFSGLGDALISMAPAKMLIAWSLRSFKKASLRPVHIVKTTALHA